MSDSDWENVAWSDEAYVGLDDKKGHIWVTRKAGEEYLDEWCVGSVPQSPVRLMVWAIIMKGAKGPLIILEYPGGKGGKGGIPNLASNKEYDRVRSKSSSAEIEH